MQGEEGEIGVEEMRRTVRKMKSGAGGVCSIQVEMVKAAGYTMVHWLKEVLNVAWRNGKTPHKWREVIIIPTYL